MARARLKLNLSELSSLLQVALGETNGTSRHKCTTKEKKKVRKNLKINRMLIKGKVEYGISIAWNIIMYWLNSSVSTELKKFSRITTANEKNKMQEVYIRMLSFLKQWFSNHIYILIINMIWSYIWLYGEMISSIYTRPQCLVSTCFVHIQWTYNLIC